MRRLNRFCIAAMASLMLVSVSLYCRGDRLWSPQIDNSKNLKPGRPQSAAPTGARRIAPALQPLQFDDPLLLLEQEEPEARSEWFISQRAYPFDTVSAEARREAWESVRHQKQADDDDISPAASNTWQHIGPSPTTSAYLSAWGMTSGRINAVAVSNANSQIIIIGSSTGGLWRSTNGGASFAPVSDDQVDLAVGSLSFSKSDPQIVYAGMG
ncbi:MAG: hypothetical protein AB1631_34300, partial [Acidobacteriota bacterium]